MGAPKGASWPDWAQRAVEIASLFPYEITVAWTPGRRTSQQMRSAGGLTPNREGDNVRFPDTAKDREEMKAIITAEKEEVKNLRRDHSRAD